jgi:DNA-binding MarR family transcriptional regulator
MPTNHEDSALIVALAQAYKRVIGRVNSELKPIGASFEIWSILHFVDESKGKTMSAIAKAAEMNSPAATKLVDRLVSENIVYRRHSRADRRIVNIFLTEKGSKILSDARDVLGNIENQLCQSAEELRDLTEKLRTI